MGGAGHEHLGARADGGGSSSRIKGLTRSSPQMDLLPHEAVSESKAGPIFIRMAGMALGERRSRRPFSILACTGPKAAGSRPKMRCVNCSTAGWKETSSSGPVKKRLMLSGRYRKVIRRPMTGSVKTSP